MPLGKVDQHADMQGWGGEEMAAKGLRVTKHYRELAFMGFLEVVRHLPAIMRNFKSCKKEILAYAPDALILVDYPGFNLRMASWAHKQGLPVYYYISPQLWAWHTSRVHKIKEAVRRMYVILPFESSFYARYGVDALYIGHPLAQAMNEQHEISVEKTVNQVALLPGSRKHEVELILPHMINLARSMPAYNFKVIAVQHLPLQLYQDIIIRQPNVEVAIGNMHQVIRQSEAAIVTSGTATLETALLGTPQVVVYKGNPLSYQLAKRMIKVPYISLVNLIADKQLVPELIQDDCNAVSLQKNLLHILEPGNAINIKHGYKKLRTELMHGGGPGAAALDIYEDLQKNANSGQV